MLNLSVLQDLDEIDGSGGYPQEGQLYCPNCGDYRRMQVRGLHNYFKPGQTPRLWEYVCFQCHISFVALAYMGPNGSALAVLPSCRGGLTTAHTPDGVSYYLDQASKAQSIGANSASIAMFRGALEHLLFEQGYKDGMLGAKLTKLEADIKKGTASKWAMELEIEFLDVMKQLGNGAIHPNDGDITKQSALDNELIEQVKETFQMLLFLVYELPHQKVQRLTSLKAKASMLKK